MAFEEVAEGDVQPVAGGPDANRKLVIAGRDRLPTGDFSHLKI
jgi:hypothetical protein